MTLWKNRLTWSQSVQLEIEKKEELHVLELEMHVWNAVPYSQSPDPAPILQPLLEVSCWFVGSPVHATESRDDTAVETTEKQHNSSTEGYEIYGPMPHAT